MDEILRMIAQAVGVEKVLRGKISAELLGELREYKAKEQQIQQQLNAEIELEFSRIKERITDKYALQDQRLKQDHDNLWNKIYTELGIENSNDHFSCDPEGNVYEVRMGG